MPEGAGAVSLVPCLVVFALAVWTRRPLEALIAGALVGHALLSGAGFAAAFLDNLMAVMAEPASVWVVLVVALFGALIGVLARSGGARAFGELLGRRLKSPRQVQLAAFGLGILTFVDDYLNALAVGAAFRGAADRLGVSRARLAYVVDSTAAPVCVLAPASTWAVFVAGLFEANELAPAGEGIGLYFSLLPFLLYPWFALALVFAFALGAAPAFGPMRAADRPGANSSAGRPPALDESLEADEPSGSARRPALRPLVFLFAILALPAATLAFGGDALLGVSFAIVLAVGLTALAGTRPGPIAEGAVLGIEKMVYPVGIVLVSFVLRDVNAALGLTEFVLEWVRPAASAWMLPALVFAALSFVTFASGSFWGAYAVSLPVVLGLSAELGAPLPLTLGALVSAGAFGSHACFYGDATVLAARSAGCPILEHARTQLPYALAAAGAAFLGFLGLGLAMAAH